MSEKTTSVITLLTDILASVMSARVSNMKAEDRYEYANYDLREQLDNIQRKALDAINAVERMR